METDRTLTPGQISGLANLIINNPKAWKILTERRKEDCEKTFAASESALHQANTGMEGNKNGLEMAGNEQRNRKTTKRASRSYCG